MDSDVSAMNIQHCARRDAEDLQSYLMDLNNWEKDMHKKEEDLRNMQTSADQELPPIRNSQSRSKKKSRHKKQREKSSSSPELPVVTEDATPLDKSDNSKPNDEDEKHSTSSENSDNEEDLSLQKRKQMAIMNKDKGNENFKKGNFDQAITFYTSGMELDPDNPLLPANRAMAFLKKRQFQAAENDCTLCLSIDPTYVKAYLRRGTARCGLEKIGLAREDFSMVLELEPENRQAKAELKKFKTESHAAEAKKLKQDTKSDEDVVKFQNFWPQFLGRREDVDSSEWFQGVSGFSASSVESKYPDSSVISSVQKASKERSKKPMLDVEVREVNPLSEVMEVDTKDAPESTSGSEKSSSESSEQDSTSSSTSSAVSVDFLLSRETMYKVPLPPIPLTSFQFLTDWKKVKGDADLAYQYIKQFPYEKLPTVFKHSMDTELFSGYLEVLSTSFLENKDDVFPYVKHLSEIGRFNTLLMFLSGSERKALKMILDSIKIHHADEPDAIKVLKRFRAM